MIDAYHCSGPHLRNDLYCIEWDVKLYYTIPCLPNVCLTVTVCDSSNFGRDMRSTECHSSCRCLFSGPKQVSRFFKIKMKRFTWFGHVTGMDKRQLPSRAMHCHIEATRNVGRQPKDGQITSKMTLQIWDLISTAVGSARDRRRW